MCVSYVKEKRRMLLAKFSWAMYALCTCKPLSVLSYRTACPLWLQRWLHHQQLLVSGSQRDHTQCLAKWFLQVSVYTHHHFRTNINNYMKLKPNGKVRQICYLSKWKCFFIFCLQKLYLVHNLIIPTLIKP